MNTAGPPTALAASDTPTSYGCSTTAIMEVKVLSCSTTAIMEEEVLNCSTTTAIAGACAVNVEWLHCKNATACRKGLQLICSSTAMERCNCSKQKCEGGSKCYTNAEHAWKRLEKILYFSTLKYRNRNTH